MTAKLAFVFPGQASQREGMAAELLAHSAEARELFRRAGGILGLDLAGVCTTGNEALLTRTDIAQPALLTTCVGWLTAVRGRGIEAAMAAGHSLGEFSAWVAAGALEFEAALRLVRRRGELMEEAGQRNPGSMVAVIGLADQQVIEICQRASKVGLARPANYNCPGQLVVSGEAGALAEVSRLSEEAGGRAMPLKVSGAFHSPLMDDAAREFARLVAALDLRNPTIPVVANASAAPVTSAEEVRAAMSRQMTSPVLWTASVQRMLAEGAEVFAEIGPGRVLGGLIRRISGEVKTLPVGSIAQLEALEKETQS
ncbi:MAG: ACP S-malonyltransferase [Armatimonadota bacterium]